MNHPIKQKTSIYIVGAGLAGTMIAHEISEKNIFGKVAAFLDDDPKKIGTKIDGIPVSGPISETVHLFSSLFSISNPKSIEKAV